MILLVHHNLVPHNCMPNIVIFIGKSLVYTFELSQKSDFQRLTTKPDNGGHPTVKTGQLLAHRAVLNVVFHYVKIKIFKFKLKFHK